MNYIIANGELYHHGVKGMKWGVRRYQNKDGTLTKAGQRRKAKEDYDRDIEERRTSLNSQARKLWEQSKEYKWHKAHPDADFDDFGDVIADKPNFKDPKAEESRALYQRANRLNKGYAKNYATGMAVVSSVLLAPVSMTVASVASMNVKNGKARAAIILGSGLGTVAMSSLDAYISGVKEHRKAIKSEGIKSVKERIRE